MGKINLVELLKDCPRCNVDLATQYENYLGID